MKQIFFDAALSFVSLLIDVLFFPIFIHVRHQLDDIDNENSQINFLLFDFEIDIRCDLPMNHQNLMHFVKFRIDI